MTQRYQTTADTATGPTPDLERAYATARREAETLGLRALEASHPLVAGINRGEAYDKQAPGGGFYHLFNVPRSLDGDGGGEPFEQLAGFVVGAELARYTDGDAVAGIGEHFRALNRDSVQGMQDYFREAPAKAERKEALFDRVFDLLGMDGEVVTSGEVWSDQGYWDTLAGLARNETGTVIDLTEYAKDYFEGQHNLDWTRKADRMPLWKLQDSGVLEGEFDVDPRLDEVAEPLRRATGTTAPATALYPLAELGYAAWIEEEFDVGAKVGPEDEDMYDPFIQDIAGHDVVHYYQPLAMDDPSETVVPYFDEWRDSGRVLVSDNLDALNEKAEQWVTESTGHMDRHAGTLHLSGGRPHPVLYNTLVAAGMSLAAGGPGATVTLPHHDDEKLRPYADPGLDGFPYDTIHSHSLLEGTELDPPGAEDDHYHAMPEHLSLATSEHVDSLQELDNLVQDGAASRDFVRDEFSTLTLADLKTSLPRLVNDVNRLLGAGHSSRRPRTKDGARNR
ncbi:MAG: hypothetical protein SVU88_01600 [Candidatus Nanohaloarchaea archaeon]|nr:hypothetical protein [Candidatus Nanohaloarchaea archaeon]